MDLGESGTLPNLSFEVLGLLPFGGAITDAEPSAIISDLANANQFYGLAGALSLGDLTAYKKLVCCQRRISFCRYLTPKRPQLNGFKTFSISPMPRQYGVKVF